MQTHWNWHLAKQGRGERSCLLGVAWPLIVAQEKGRERGHATPRRQLLSPLPCSQRDVIYTTDLQWWKQQYLYRQHLQQSSYCHRTITRGPLINSTQYFLDLWTSPSLGYALSTIHESTNINKQPVAYSKYVHVQYNTYVFVLSVHTCPSSHWSTISM